MEVSVMKSVKSDGFKNLAVAIVEQAIHDYNNYSYMRVECRKFFKSEFCDLLCLGIINGEQILKELEGVSNESVTVLERYR